MFRSCRMAVVAAIAFGLMGCKDSGGSKVIAPTDTKPAPKVLQAGGGETAKPKLPNKGPE